MSLFLLGAGFNIDTTQEAGPIYSSYNTRDRIDCGYPLVSDVLKLCFGRNELPKGMSVESLFFEAEQRHDNKPMENLVERLMHADYY